MLFESAKEKKKFGIVQWCAYQNQNDPIYEVIDLFLTWCLTI